MLCSNGRISDASGILVLQVTKFQGGGISIGVSLSHTIADAQSFYDFVGSWAENCRGVCITVPPRHMRAALNVEALFPVEPSLGDTMLYLQKRINGYHIEADVDNYGQHGEKFLSVAKEGDRFCSSIVEQKQQDEKLAKDLMEKGLHLSAAVCKQHQVVPVGEKLVERVAAIMEKQQEEEHRRPRTDLVQKVFSFSAEGLQRLKKRVTQEGKRGSFTTFESFCGHWWQSLIRARNLPDEHRVFLLIPINCRQRFLSLPKGYFGNSLDGGLVKSTILPKLHKGSREQAKRHPAFRSNRSIPCGGFAQVSGV